MGASGGLAESPGSRRPAAAWILRLLPRSQHLSCGLRGKGAGLQGAEEVRTLSAGERLARVCCAGTSLLGTSSQVPEGTEAPRPRHEKQQNSSSVSKTPRGIPSGSAWRSERRQPRGRGASPLPGQRPRASHIELGQTKLTGDGFVGGCFLQDVAFVSAAVHASCGRPTLRERIEVCPRRRLEGETRREVWVIKRHSGGRKGGRRVSGALSRQG